MANEKTRLYNLPEVTAVNNDMYLMLDSSTTGARKYNLKTLYDKVDGVQASAQAATTAATAATAAAESANTAATAATEAAASAGETVAGLVEDVDEALDAIGDISELAVPLMSPTTRGGAKLGTGLEVTDGTLSVNTISSGDGSTAGPILSLSAKGWAEQDSTTGKNLLPVMTASKTTYGVTFTANADGSVTANGTATSVINNYKIVTLQAGTYTLKGCPSGGGFDKYELDYVIEGASEVGARDFGNNGVTFTIAEQKQVTIQMLIRSGVTCNNLTFYPQLELGSTATSYEPYTGGAPSPSPDYPQEIRVCRGRNLLDKSSIDNTNKYFDSSGNVQTGNGYAISDYIPVTAGSDYVASGFGATNNTYAVWYDSSKTKLSTSMETSYGFALTAPTSAAYVRLTLRDVSTYPTPQLERGSVVHGYVPYGDYVGLEAHTRNLLPNLLTDVYAYSNGVVTQSSYYVRSQKLPCLPSTQYVMSSASDIGNDSGFLFWGADGNFLSAVHPALTATAPANAAYMAVNIKLKSNAQITPNDIVNPQLEKGSTATPFEPYYHSTTPIPLPSRGWVASLPDGTADTLTLDLSLIHI